MSFAGVTFSEQKVSPSDDAMLMQAILDDGIIYGCELDFAGFTLTMGAGNLVVHGRHIRHSSSQSWAVDGATSGYARLVLTVDLSLPSTEEVFGQVVTAVEYAADADGFPVLEQSEINVAGVRYQAEICVVELSTGGITGIIRQISGVSVSAEPAAHTHGASDIEGTVPMTKGGTGAAGGQAGLTNLLAAGYMVASSYQIVSSVSAIPSGAPANAIFFVPLEG